MYLSTEELADRLDVPVGTVRSWRHRGEGPRAHKFGRHVRYLETDVEAWESDHADATPAA